MKKFIALLLVVALTATISVSATMAYLQDEDSDVNVMTLGNVKIAQHEYERVVDENGNYEKTTVTTKSGSTVESYKVREFTQAKPLFPSVGEITGWDDTAVRWEQLTDSLLAVGGQKPFAGLNNVQDKFVLVENTGKSDAYVRTLIALEYGSNTKDIVGLSTGDFWTWNGIGVVAIDGNNYYVYEAIYKGADGRHVGGVLPAGEYTYNSLGQIYLANEATNEDMEALDGNNNGTYDVLVLSQAVQVEGFADAATALNTAFGAVADNAADWFEDVLNAVPESDGYEVANDEDLAAAVEAGETEILLKTGTYHMPAAAKGKTLTISGTKDSVIEVVPAGQGEANGQLDYNLDGSNVTFNGVTIKTNSQLYAGYARLSATYNNCVIQNTYNLSTGNSAFYNCEINITNEYLRVGGASSAIFDGCTFNTDGRAILVFQDGTSVAQTVTVKDCTFNATAAANTWNGIHIAAVSIDGTNGTYVVNLEGTNTVDSDFNGLWQIKAGEANVTVNQ